VRATLRRTIVLSGSSLVSIVAGIVSSKAFALLLGPSGLGFMGLLQSMLGLGFMVAAMGIGVGLIRAGATALADGEQQRITALRTAMIPLRWVLGGVTIVVIVGLHQPIAALVLGSRNYSWTVVLVGVALLFTLAEGVQTSTLNAYHRVKALAQINALSAIFGSGVLLVGVWKWGRSGIAPGMIAGAVFNWVVAGRLLRREIGPRQCRPGRTEVADAARSLLRFGIPYTASLLAGAGALLALPVLVLHVLGPADVGFYRAATAVSISYLGFLLSAMTQDYLPLVSAARHDATELVRLVNEQLHLVLILGVPLILGVLALAPYLVPLIYSPAFMPTVAILEWQLIGDLFKFAAFSMSLAILARCGSGIYLAAETVCGAGSIGLSWLGMRWFGLPGLGMAFLAAYILYYLTVWLILRREIGLSFDHRNRLLFLVAIVLMAIIRILPMAGLGSLHTAIATSLALAVAIASGCLVWRELGGLVALLRPAE
jgi:antigen flippase